MIILFEGYRYRNNLGVQALLPEYYFEHFPEHIKLSFVGYFNSPNSERPIIILPKAFLTKNNKFFIEDIDPEVFLENDYLEKISDTTSQSDLKDSLFDLTSWFYYSIKKYLNKFSDTVIGAEEEVSNISCSRAENFHSELDIILSLLNFNRKNRDYFTYIKKINQSQNSKIDWPRTIRKNQLIVKDGIPVYTGLYSKRKQINIDEELIVIYLTLLKNLKNKYGLNVYINPLFNLLSNREFDKLKSRGAYHLRRIRHKYFEDKLVYLYQILFSYFEKLDQSKRLNAKPEFLLIRNYNLVFQDMVDELISDTGLPKGLKAHKDGKELDHIYRSESFFTPDKIFSIGDSKYYKTGSVIEKKSIYKQYTYAKNVVQYNIDVFNETGESYSETRYRDDLTEGYNITPNFFIRGIVNHFDNLDPEFFIDEEFNMETYLNFHWPNRIFDRDSLILQSYKINFLFVLWNYIHVRNADNEVFKSHSQKTLNENFKKFIQSRYNFYKLSPEADSLKDFVQRNFYKLNGRVYRPQSFESNALILGLEKSIDVNDFLTQNLEGKANYSNYHLD